MFVKGFDAVLTLDPKIPNQDACIYFNKSTLCYLKAITYIVLCKLDAVHAVNIRL